MKHLPRTLRPFYAKTRTSFLVTLLSLLFGTGCFELGFKAFHTFTDEWFKSHRLQDFGNVIYFALVAFGSTSIGIIAYLLAIKFSTRRYPATYIYCFSRTAKNGHVTNLVGFFYLECSVEGQVVAEGQDYRWNDSIDYESAVNWRSQVVAAVPGQRTIGRDQACTCYIFYSAKPMSAHTSAYTNGIFKFESARHQNGILSQGGIYSGFMQEMDQSTIWQPVYAERIEKGYASPERLNALINDNGATLIAKLPSSHNMQTNPNPANVPTPIPTATPAVGVPRHVLLLLWVAALGYFVDVYDLIIFSVVRKASLAGLGIADDQTLAVGVRLFNWQVAGVLLGGIVWGIIGDKHGRMKVLFGSIILYSITNLWNASIHSIPAYEALRFFAGFGLAGELGAGITIVSEVVSTKRRGLATMLIASVGLLGAWLASWVGAHFDWRQAYMIGGILGLGLLILRLGTFESTLFTKVRGRLDVRRGDIFMLLKDPTLRRRYALCILAGAPLYFVIGILLTYSPEFGTNEGLSSVPVAGTAIMWAYLAMSVGDVLCSLLSQVTKSRRLALVVSHILCLMSCLIFIYGRSPSLAIFYGKCALLGLSIGYWAVLNTNAAEQFGTNLRATVATSVPNFVRGLLIPISFVFGILRPIAGLAGSAIVLTILLVTVALGATWFLRETFNEDLDKVEATAC